MVAKLMLLHAETPMHPGAGSALGTVDLPVARERHTGFPLIPGSSLKGVLRDKCRNGADTAAKVAAVFGPETNNAAEHAGALSLTDARILVFPLRSLSGLFAWVTCPAVLERFVRDLGMVGANEDLKNSATEVLEQWNGLQDHEGTALVATDSPLIARLGAGANAPASVVLEEYEYTAAPAAPVGALGGLLDQRFQGAPLRLKTHLAVISDDAFGYATKFATEVMARIALDYNTKTVKDKALFYEEFLPASTVFYSVAIAENPRKIIVPGMESEADVLGFVSASLALCANVIQVGANATTGKGLCTAMLV